MSASGTDIVHLIHAVGVVRPGKDAECVVIVWGLRLCV